MFCERAWHCLQFSSVAQSCPTLCDPMNHSTPGLPVNHQLPEFTQTHVHRISDAIQPSHPWSSPSPPAPNPSQHQSFPMSQLFAWHCLRLGLFQGKFSLSLSLFFFLSLALPQFGLLSHVSSLRLHSGHSGSVLALSNAAGASLFSPHLLVVAASVWLLLCWELPLGT